MQEYITNPLLLNRKKFHIRMFYIVTLIKGVKRCYLLKFGSIILVIFSDLYLDFILKLFLQFFSSQLDHIFFSHNQFDYQ